MTENKPVASAFEAGRSRRVWTSKALIATAVVVGFAAIVWVFVGSRILAARRIASEGGFLVCEDEADPERWFLEWLRTQIGRDSFDDWVLPLLQIDWVVFPHDESRGDVDNTSFSAISRFPSVRKVQLRRGRVDRATIETLVALPRLEYVDLSDSQAGDDEIASLGACRSLTVLHARCSGVTEAGFDAWERPEMLAALSLDSPSRIRRWDFLRRFRNLEDLMMPEPESDEFLRHLPRLASLYYLDERPRDRSERIAHALRLKALCPSLKWYNFKEYKLDSNGEFTWRP